ncbi:hypothetical protein GDO78_014419 [Eleutherodactylus coqui]|uniref:Taste receptor type 2 n=1 Tax=Eleutherodactylus coqui TaxID=57060 RepID=A0A8J6B7X1_ELECQ|nr:hypothetical protein GDO78_014419 [Eleutherodactylus coqui]
MVTNIIKTLEISVPVIDCISLLICLPGCMFILVVNILDWRKNKRLDINDQLISGLGILILIYRSFQASFSCTLQIYEFYVITSLAWFYIYLTYYSLGFLTLVFSTWLSIHFCLKIVNINQNIYIYIQHNFPKMFPWILLPSVLASLLISGPVAQNMSEQSLNFNDSLLYPSSSPLTTLLSVQLYFVFFAFCFLIIVISLLLTIVSLYRHIQRMQSFRSEMVEAHVSAVKMLIALIGFNLTFFALMFLFMLKRHEPVWMTAAVLSNASFHILAIPIIIRGSRKLHIMLHKILLHCMTSVS